MRELIKITEKDGRQVVSARELHAFLGSKRQFINWIQDRIEKYDFVENHDFVCLTNLLSGDNVRIAKGGSNKIEYVLTLDCAKELAMVEGNEKGKQARRYFIECEKRLKVITKPFSQLEIMQQSINILLEQERRIEYLEKDIQDIKAITTRPNYFTVVGYCTLKGITISMKQAANAGRKASAICKKRNIDTDTIPDPRFGVVNTYPKDVLKDVFTQCSF